MKQVWEVTMLTEVHGSVYLGTAKALRCVALFIKRDLTYLTKDLRNFYNNLGQIRCCKANTYKESDRVH